jgi:hypothetical protein
MDKVVLVRVPSPALHRLASAAAELQVPLLDVATGGGDACASIPLLNLPDWEVRRATLAARLEGAATFADGYALVSVVGDGLTTGSSLPRFLDVLATAGIPAPDRVVAGPLRLSALVRSPQLGETQRALHAAFVV